MKYGSFEAAASVHGGLHDLAQPVAVPRKIRVIETPGVSLTTGLLGSEDNFYCSPLNQLYRTQHTLVDIENREVTAQLQVQVGRGDCTVPMYEAPPANQESGIRPDYDDFIVAMLNILKSDGFQAEVTVGAYLSLLWALMPKAQTAIEKAMSKCDIVAKIQKHETVQAYFDAVGAFQQAGPLRTAAEEWLRDNKGAPIEVMPDDLREALGMVEPNPQEDDVLISAYKTSADQGVSFSAGQYHTILGILMLIIPKRLDASNYEVWMQRRFQSFQSQLGLQDKEVEELSELKPSQPSCEIITRFLGNKMPVRRFVFTLASDWMRGEKSNMAKQIAMILMTLYANVDTTHIQLIERYIINEVPALMACAPVRAEANSVFSAILRMVRLGDKAPYARMLYGQEELPELHRRKMSLTAAFAQELAIRDYASFKNYARKSNETFEVLLSELRTLYDYTTVALCLHPTTV